MAKPKNAKVSDAPTSEVVLDIIDHVFDSGASPSRTYATSEIKKYIEAGRSLNVHIPQSEPGRHGEGIDDGGMGIGHVLASYAAPATMGAFIARGGNINMQNSAGETAAHIFTTSGIYNSAAKLEDISKMAKQLSGTSLKIHDKDGLNFAEAGYARLVYGDNKYFGETIVAAIEHADKNDPNFARFKPVQEALIEKFGREKVIEMAQHGIDVSAKKRELDLHPQHDKNLPKSRFDTGAVTPEFETLAKNLQGQGLKTTEVALAKPSSGNEPSRGLA